MDDSIKLHYDVKEKDFSRAGEASSDLKSKLKKLSIPSAIVRRIAIAMYEGEINMVAHANGGTIDVELFEDRITMVLRDTGPGIADINAAMKEGFSTASDEVRAMGFGAGMGLPNMKRSSDEMTIKSEVNVGTDITMTVYFM